MSEQEVVELYNTYGVPPDADKPPPNYSFIEGAIPTKTPIPVRMRFFDVSDTNFILNSWLKSFREAPSVATISAEAYFNGQQQLIAALAQTSQILVACDKQDPSQIFGWICYEQGPDASIIVHFVYVKHRYRGFGVGKLLLGQTGWAPGAELWVTHLTRPTTALMQKYAAKHNPYILTFRGYTATAGPT